MKGAYRLTAACLCLAFALCFAGCGSARKDAKRIVGEWEDTTIPAESFIRVVVNDIDSVHYPVDLSGVTVTVYAVFNEDGTYTMLLDSASVDTVADIVYTDTMQTFPAQIEAQCEYEGITVDEYLSRCGLDSMEQYVGFIVSGQIANIFDGQPLLSGCYEVREDGVCLTDSPSAHVTDGYPTCPYRLRGNTLTLNAPDGAETEASTLFPLVFTRK